MKFILILLWLISAFFIAAKAEKQGRSYFLFLLISFLFGPLIGYLILLFIGENEEVLKKRQYAASSSDDEEIAEYVVIKDTEKENDE